MVGVVQHLLAAAAGLAGSLAGAFAGSGAAGSTTGGFAGHCSTRASVFY